MRQSAFLLILVLLVSCQEEQLAPTQAQATAKSLATFLEMSFDTPSTTYLIVVADLETDATLFTALH